MIYSMSRSSFLVVVGCAIVTGCMSADIAMYPIEGPYSKTVPLQVAKAKAIGVENNSGKLIATLPNGEKCEGKWSSVAPQFASASTGSLWGLYGGAVFGTSVTTGIMPGVNKGQAFMTCSAGTTVEAEYFTGSGTANGYGVAKDSAGNVYKMLF